MKLSIEHHSGTYKHEINVAFVTMENEWVNLMAINRQGADQYQWTERTIITRDWQRLNKSIMDSVCNEKPLGVTVWDQYLNAGAPLMTLELIAAQAKRVFIW